MKQLLTFLFTFCCLFGSSQTTPFSFTQIPFSDPDFTYTPERAAESWQGQNIVNIPVEGTNTPRSDKYQRYQWIDLQPSNASGPGVGMNWTTFDNDIQAAINAGQGFHFGIMPNCCSGPTVGGASLVYPLALHNGMQAEAVKDWNNGGGWYENPNSPTWLTWFRALHQAIYQHIQNTSYLGIPFSKVVSRIDVRILGDYGEQAVLNTGPAGTKPTDAASIALVDAVVQSYPTIRCAAMVGAFGANTGVGISSQAVGYYELTTSNQVGVLGWRWDSWGWTDGYMHSWLENNPNVVNGYHFDTAIMARYKYAPIGGEPADLNNATNNFADLPVRVNQYHASYFGNGNLDVNNPPNATIKNNFRAASKACGYRITVTGGNSTITPVANGPFAVSMTWQNSGLAPSYHDWDVTYELRSGATVVWTGTSAMKIKYFQPTAITVNDNFSLTGVAAGTYNMYLVIRDHGAYLKPLPIAITGRLTDGAYLLRSVTVAANGGGPTSNAGPDQQITIPNNSVFLDGSASTNATAYFWTLLSGPGPATIISANNITTAVNNLVPGVYIFNLMVNGSINDQVQVTVNPGPIANAGPDQIISLPTSSVTLSAAASTGTIITYAWTRVSGPNLPNIVTPGAVSTTVTGLVAGVYVFQVQINGNVSSDQVTVTVNAAPSGTTVLTNQVPASGLANDHQPSVSIEVGMKFRSSAAGTIVALRFYKLAGDLATHTGKLYSSTGTLLASVVFTGESASGWQQMALPSPVGIVPSTTYIVTVLNSLGNYVFTNNAFASSIINSPLVGLQNGLDGPNGVYKYGGGFPTSSFNNSNYFVDAVYSSTLLPATGVRHTIGKLLFKDF